MKPELRRFGTEQSPVVVIDEFSGAVEEIARLADELAPFPPIQGNYYPGVRRAIGAADEAAYAYVLKTCNEVAPFVGGAFNVGSFDLKQASFSIVSLEPGQLKPVQKAPHFDGPEPNLYALLHYLRVPPGSGTAFYRHRATGIERVTPANMARLVAAAKPQAEGLPVSSGYIHGSDEFYEEIGRVEAVPDRLVLYQGSLLHSGVIPADMPFTADPREGRLTANFFLLGR